MGCHDSPAVRRGNIAVEAVIAVALLTTATVALAKLARSASQLQQQADGRCAAMLAAENVLARIEDLPVNRVQAAAMIAATQVELDSGCRVDVKADRFAASGRDAIHLQVSVTPDHGPPVTAHDWRFNPLPNSSNVNPQEPSDAK